MFILAPDNSAVKDFARDRLHKVLAGFSGFSPKRPGMAGNRRNRQTAPPETRQGGSLSKNPFQIIFGVLRTLRYQWQSCGQLRKYGNGAPAKELCSLDARQPFKKGWTLNF